MEFMKFWIIDIIDYNIINKEDNSVSNNVCYSLKQVINFGKKKYTQ